MQQLYPLKFKPIFKDKIWGGARLKDHFGMDFSPLPNCGEAWVLSGVEKNQTLVSNGFLRGNELNELVEVFMADLVGENNFDRFGNEFPILLKFIDSNDWLSIQVHPDDILAGKRHGQNGKSEMWYVLDADPGSQLICGFSKKTNRDSYLAHLHAKTLKEIMNYQAVKAGDAFYMPAGTVHALGPGILLAEIQQTSDLTYRIYDWDRIDAAGFTRELHTDAALEAIHFEKQQDIFKLEYDKTLNKTSNLVSQPHFEVNVLNFNNEIHKDLSEVDSFIILIAVQGKLKVSDRHRKGETELKAGEVILLPAIMEEVILKPVAGPAEILEVFIP